MGLEPSNITVHQLEQAIHLERAVRFGEEMVHDHAVKEHFSSEVEHFKKLAAKVDHEIKEGEELADHAITQAATAHEKQEFVHVATTLRSIKAAHKIFDEHALHV
ncbi:MAG: hypothetical protein ACKVH0_12870, partial [Alphaproteobacteria bacterium]